MIAYNGSRNTQFSEVKLRVGFDGAMSLIKLNSSRCHDVTLMVFLALPALAWAQSDPASLLPADAAPYLKLAIFADFAAQ